MTVTLEILKSGTEPRRGVRSKLSHFEKFCKASAGVGSRKGGRRGTALLLGQGGQESAANLLLGLGQAPPPN